MDGRIAFVCLLAVLGGCAGLPDTGSGPDGPSATPTLEPGAHPGLTADLEIWSQARRPVHLTIVETNEYGRGVVLNETYRDVGTIEPGIFRENGDYRVTIRVNGTVEWNEVVNHFESFDLRIHRNGTVTVTSHAVA